MKTLKELLKGFYDVKFAAIITVILMFFINYLDNKLRLSQAIGDMLYIAIAITFIMAVALLIIHFESKLYLRKRQSKITKAHSNYNHRNNNT